MEDTMYYCCGVCDIGTARANNEDAFLIGRTVIGETYGNKIYECSLNAPFAAAVADGVGGERSGEIASSMALKLLSQYKFRDTDPEVADYLMKIHKKLVSYGAKHPESTNMQTTLCGVLIDDFECVTVINAGDSRLYRYRGGEIRQLTKDQSLVQLLYDAGRISYEEKHGHAQKNIILPVLGSTNDTPKPEVIRLDGFMLSGDILLACSDGLSDCLTAAQIEETLALPMHLSKRVAELVRQAKASGSKDNITVLAINRTN